MKIKNCCKKTLEDYTYSLDKDNQWNDRASQILLKYISGKDQCCKDILNDFDRAMTEADAWDDKQKRILILNDFELIDH